MRAFSVPVLSAKCGQSHGIRTIFSREVAFNDVLNQRACFEFDDLEDLNVSYLPS